MKKVVLFALLCCVVSSTLFAGSLTSYSIGDVLICFRKSPGPYDLVVDAGPITSLTNSAPNTRITITGYTTNQLYVLGLQGGLIWSAFSYYDSTVSSPAVPWTLFTTKPRSNLNTETAPYDGNGWEQQGALQDEPVAGYMGTGDGVVAGAQAIYNIFPAYNALNTVTAVIEPDGANNDYVNGSSYEAGIISNQGNDNWQGEFTGSPENICANGFATSGVVARSDFWIDPPVSNPNTQKTAAYLGYFELSTNGVMTFVAYGYTPAVPVISSVTRASGISHVSFTTGSQGTYYLRGTNTLASGVAPQNWPVISSVTGNGSTESLQDTTSATNKFYIITAQ